MFIKINTTFYLKCSFSKSAMWCWIMIFLAFPVAGSVVETDRPGCLLFLCKADCPHGFAVDSSTGCQIGCKCASPLACGKNEETFGCGACDNTCALVRANDSQLCTQDCRPPECGCMSGYARHEYGECVLEAACASPLTCGKNEELFSCGACDNTCALVRANNSQLCTQDCGSPQCGCIAGYARHENRECVPESACGDLVCPPPKPMVPPGDACIHETIVDRNGCEDVIIFCF